MKVLITRLLLVLEVGMKTNLWKIMSWEFFGVVGFHLGPLLQGQMRIAKLKMLITHLLLVLEVSNGNQPIENHGLGIFWCGRI